MNELTEDQKARMAELRREEMRVAFIAAAINGLTSSGNEDNEDVGRQAVEIADDALWNMAEKQKAAS